MKCECEAKRILRADSHMQKHVDTKWNAKQSKGHFMTTLGKYTKVAIFKKKYSTNNTIDI